MIVKRQDLQSKHYEGPELILMYHKVDVITPSQWWVSAKGFRSQIASLLDRYELVYLDKYDVNDKQQVVVTFDDAYENVFRHAFPVLQELHLPFEIFIIGDLLGNWNDYDKTEMRTRFCSVTHIQEMADNGARIQWHSKSHKNLVGLNNVDLKNELTVNPELKAVFPEPHFRWFSYPYGFHNESVVQEVRKKFSGAVSVEQGSDFDRFQLNRISVDENWLP